MFEEISAMMQRRSDLLISDRFEDLARYYVFPLALYTDGQMVAINDESQMMKLLSSVRESQRQRQVARLKAEIKAMELPRNGRFRVWVRHVEQDGQGRVSGVTDAVHYCRETPQGIRGEMSEFVNCHLPGTGSGATPPQVNDH